MKIYIRAKKIETILIRRNKSKGWLIDRLGITSTYFSQMMKHDRSPSGAMREKIMKSLGVKIAQWDDLFYIETF